MYEIWLGLNIAYEFLLPFLIPLGLALLTWVILVFLVSRDRRVQWRNTFKPTLILMVLVTIGAGLIFPTASSSGLGEVRYVVDWLFLIATAVGAGVATGLALWPLLAWVSRRA